jgi:hypothetical protein
MRIKSFQMMMLLFSLACLPVRAVNNAVAIGTVDLLQLNSTSAGGSPETVMFTLSEMPTAVWCGPFHRFAVSPVSVTDGQTRKNMVATLLAAKAAGQRLQVAFDNTGAFCDQGYMGIYYIAVL